MRSVAYSPDGWNTISEDRNIRIWDVEIGTAVNKYLFVDTDYVRSVAYSPNGISGSTGRTI